MKTRTFSIIIMALILIPFLVIGGVPFKIISILVSLLALKEYVEVKKNIPNLVKYFSIFVLGLILLIMPNSIKTVIYILLTFLVLVVSYNNSKIYGVNDAFYLVVGLLILYFGFNCIIELRNTNYKILVYLLLITIMTDTFAYIVGVLLGKHKLIPEISPKKTIEGLLGGLLFGSIIPIIYYINTFNDINIMLIVRTIILSLTSQFGDLVFSSIKRNYHIKDFSSLIPGHGGVLDRIDGLLFVMLGYLMFI